MSGVRYKGYVIHRDADGKWFVNDRSGSIVVPRTHSLLAAKQRITRIISRTEPAPPQDTYAVEVTDTFGGEANYSWVRRYKIKVPKGATQNMIVRRAKAAAGWSAWRCLVSNHGDLITVKPFTILQVMFITFKEPE